MDGLAWPDYPRANAIVLVGSAALAPPVPYCSIFHPPPQGGLPASLLMCLLCRSISLAYKLSHSQSVSKTLTTEPVSSLKASSS